MAKRYPTLEQEYKLMQAGYATIAGLDEAGRGAWAGPVAAAAVLLPLHDPALPERLRGVCDSKLCTPRQRGVLYDVICGVALSWAVSLVPAARIDEIGIVPATRQAMREAIERLVPPPDALLIDFVRLPSVRLPQRSLTKGDLRSLSIAAASIVAKVSRDREMIALSETHPGYGFARHKGYGTTRHREALQRLGPLPNVHRWSFAPVSAAAIKSSGTVNMPGLQPAPQRNELLVGHPP
jgi:ribonuclease HII